MTGLPRNLYEQQRINRRTTVLVMILFTLLVALLGYGFDLIILDSVIPVGTVAAVGLGIGTSFWSLSGGTRAVLVSSGAQPIIAGNPAHQQLRNVTEEMAIASGLPVPQLHVIPDPDPNAFATGQDPGHSHIAVTQGLLERLNREELQGVIAHEMAHIRNYDIRLMTVVAALIGAVLLISELGARSLYLGGARRRSSKEGASPLLLVGWIVGLILAPFVSRILAMAVSRQREYLADASAAELTRNPGALASALEKIDAAVEPTRSIKKGSAHLCIADPLARPINAREGLFANLLATHPPVLKRIALLKAMAYQ
ncbi:MAG: M48 family metallopeptidase [Ignavibacteria bacterium]|nr:M48 family metallopeptidase [Ignavibacteria bacterium]